MATATKSRIEKNGSPAAHDVAGMSIVIPKIEPKILELEVVGITPLLVCAWSEKARRQILDKQMKKANRGKEAKNPEEDYKNSLYVSTEGWTGIPAGGVKGCLVNACRAVADLSMTVCQRMLFVQADGYTSRGQSLVRVYGEHEMHDGPVRLTSGVADWRFRPIYRKWELKLRIEFLSNMISAEQVANLVELAGYVEGLCEHRPGSPKNHTGENGRFQIKRAE